MRCKSQKFRNRDNQKHKHINSKQKTSQDFISSNHLEKKREKDADNLNQNLEN